MAIDRSDVIARIGEIQVRIHDLGFPHEDCRRISALRADAEWILADLNAYFRDLWFMSAVDKLVQRSGEELQGDKVYLQKSFFDRWTQYRPVQSAVTLTFVPTLYKTLEANETLRELILSVVLDELKSRESALRS